MKASVLIKEITDKAHEKFGYRRNNHVNDCINVLVACQGYNSWWALITRNSANQLARGEYDSYKVKITETERAFLVSGTTMMHALKCLLDKVNSASEWGK